ncbi:MAG: fimbria/pilus periplasmic chaperone [Chlamydiales bacterium]|nr:fimbria/pilus periplasmic chaperone [Chlamydiales bacterium]NCF71802.1 fimbria/pilus periplasmic chaperone [Chlamydiales bacterium]
MLNWRTLLALSCLYTSSLFSFELTPISMSLSPSGEESSGVIRLVNPHDAPKAIQVSITTRQPDNYGNENNQDAEDHFLVYPPQIVLMPKQTQVIRISWIGEPKLDTEQAFRFIAEELNVELDEQVASGEKKPSNIRLLMKYEGALYVEPSSKGKSQVSLHKIGQHASDDDKLSFYFENSGNLHQVLYDLNLTLQQNGKEYHYSTDQLRGISGMNVLAKSKRYFSLPKPEGFDNKTDYQINFEIDETEELD